MKIWILLKGLVCSPIQNQMCFCCQGFISLYGYFRGSGSQKEDQDFMKAMFMQPLGNSLSNVYSGSLGNEDTALKARPSKCDDHSGQINKAALTPDLVCSQRQRATKASSAPRVPGHAPCPHLRPCSSQAGRPHLLLASPQTLPWQECIYGFHSPAVGTTGGSASVFIGFPTNQLLALVSILWPEGQAMVAARLLWHPGLLTNGWGCCSILCPEPQQRRQ